MHSAGITISLAVLAVVLAATGVGLFALWKPEPGTPVHKRARTLSAVAVAAAVLLLLVAGYLAREAP